MAVTLGVGPVTGGLPASSASSFTLTLTGTTAGRSIVVALTWTPTGSFTDVSSVACSGESNLTLHGSTVTDPTSGRKTRIASLANITTGGDKTITVTINASVNAQNYCMAYAVEFAGTNTGSFFDTLTSATGSGTNCTVDVTPTNANALLVGVSVNDWADATAGSGYTMTIFSGGAQHGAAEYKLDAGAVGAKTVNFGTNASSHWAIIAAAFNAVPSSPTLTPSTASLSLTGSAPSVGATYNIAPPAGGLTLAGYAPTALNSSSPMPMPGTATLSMTGYAPSLPGVRVSGSAALTLTGYAPSFTITDIYWDADNTLLFYTASASGENNEGIGTADITGPVLDIDAQGVGGGVDAAAIDLLLHGLEAGGNPGLDAELLGYEVDASAVSGGTAGADIACLVHAVSAQGLADNWGSADTVLLAAIVTGSGYPNGIGTLAADLALQGLDATAFSGVTGSADVELLVYDLTTVGFAAGTAAADITAFIAAVESAGFAGLAETYRTWVLNLRTAAVTEYSGFAFNSLAEFNGAILAAGPSGIHVVGAADTDAGAAVNARARTGAPDFGSSWLKRVPRLYVTGAFPDNVYFRTLAERDGLRTYLLAANGETGHQQRRVPVGKGPKSVHWQFEIENVNGSDFRLDKIIAYPLELRRRIQ